MKKLFWITCAIFILSVSTAYSQNVNKKEKQAEIPFTKVLGMHLLELKSDVNEKEFEAFVLHQLIPLYQTVKGQDIYLMKGDRGVRSGKYSLCIIFDNVQARDRIYPPAGGISDEFAKALEGTDKIWEQLKAYVEGEPFGNGTDYLRVVKD